MSVTVAAKSFGVPSKTLDDWMKGKVRHGTNPATPTVLSMAEEESLVNYLVYMAERCFLLLGLR